MLFRRRCKAAISGTRASSRRISRSSVAIVRLKLASSVCRGALSIGMPVRLWASIWRAPTSARRRRPRCPADERTGRRRRARTVLPPTTARTLVRRRHGSPGDGASGRVARSRADPWSQDARSRPPEHAGPRPAVGETQDRGSAHVGGGREWPARPPPPVRAALPSRAAEHARAERSRWALRWRGRLSAPATRRGESTPFQPRLVSPFLGARREPARRPAAPGVAGATAVGATARARQPRVAAVAAGEGVAPAERGGL